MDIRVSKYVTQQQINQVYRYLLSETSLQDYVRLYPDYEIRFPTLFCALPETLILDSLTLLDQIDIPKNDMEKLKDHFALTKKEGQLALMLLAGHSLLKIAEIRQVSRHTVRNQLQSIYEKTATNKQPELIRRLHDVLE